MGTTQSNGATNLSTQKLENKVDQKSIAEQNKNATVTPVSECPMHGKTSDKFITTSNKTNSERSKLDKEKLMGGQCPMHADNSNSPVASQTTQQSANTGSHASGSEEIIMENMVNYVPMLVDKCNKISAITAT